MNQNHSSPTIAPATMRDLGRTRQLIGRAAIAVSCLGLAMATAAGCSSGNAFGTSGSAREVQLSAFVDHERPAQDAAAQDSGQTTDTTGNGQSGGTGTPVTPPPVRLGAGDPEVLENSGIAAPPPDAHLLDGEPLVVESLIGQVNGRPVYASEFFEPIEDQLIQEARKSPTVRAFAASAQQIIQTHLEEVVLSELYLAQAESSLSSEERMGLFGLVKSVQEQVQALGGGTATGAESRLQELENMSVEDYLELQKNRALIRKVITEKIRPRVIVSWRDIQREYRDRYDEFNPPGTLKLSRMYISPEGDEEVVDEALVKEVQARLDGGEPFSNVAESLGFMDGGHWQELVIRRQDIDTVQLVDEMKDAIRSLKPGQTSAAFNFNDRTWWLHVAGIDQPEGRSLYDPEVQLGLQNELYRRRHSIEERRYILSLFEKGITDQMSVMNERLLNIAVTRYALR